MRGHGRGWHSDQRKSRASAYFQNLAFGVDAGLLTANPCHRLAKRGVENRGRRVLTDEEIALFWSRSSQPPVSPRVGLALKIALLTAARAGEAAGMREEEIVDIDSSRARWEIPAHRSKNGHAHVIPLSALAAQLITEAMAMATPKSPFVFASPTVKGAPITAHALAVAMQRMGRRITAEMPNFHHGSLSLLPLTICAARLQRVSHRSVYRQRT